MAGSPRARTWRAAAGALALLIISATVLPVGAHAAISRHAGHPYRHAAHAVVGVAAAMSESSGTWAPDHHGAAASTAPSGPPGTAPTAGTVEDAPVALGACAPRTRGPPAA